MHPSTATYLEGARERLDVGEYSWLDAGTTFAGAAWKKSFQMTKFGMWETFFVFREFDGLDSTTFERFVADAATWTIGHRSVSLPRGLFAGLGVFSVALAQSAGASVLAAVREKEPHKRWAAMEMPVVYDAETGQLAYYEGTPMWGAAYFRGLRKQLTDVFSPA